MRILNRWSDRTAARLGATRVFRPPVGMVVSALWVLVTVAWLAAAATAGWRSLLVQLPPLALLCVLVYATCTRPLVAVGPDGVVLRNVFRDVTVPWPALEAVDTRYALTLSAGGRRYAAWAAPASSRLSTARTTPADLKTVAWSDADGPIPASATLRSDSGAAAALIRRFWSPGAAPADPAAARAVQVRWAGGVLAAVLVTAAATALVLVLA
ncbi:PH domain-containing protein [Nakamurella deserti]|uniref:PH domain-containing protein n=1 Tax=Nakamurella deserti TaxID=2164074 RepID=UPI001300A5DD|nr:PH domain-containing protein [Nakamurella deserti]